LFVSRARAAQATLRFSDEETQVIRDVCRRLDSLPLAIELAAARVPALGLRQLGERLTERLRVLTSGSRLDAPRHQTLRAAIDWSYALLSDAERRLFEQLSVFAGGFEAEAIGPVCDGDVDVLAELVAKSLVVAEPRNGSVRYRLLQTLREYAAERLERSGQAHAVRRRHVRYFRAVAEDGSRTRRGVRYARDMDVVNREHDNLRAALSAVLASGELDEGLAICQALSGFWLSRGHLEEGTEWLRRFLERPERLTPDGLAQTLYTAGRIAEYRGALDVARHHFEVSLSVAQQHGREPHVARALFGLGDIGVHASDLDRAYAAFEAGLPLARAAGLLPEIAEALVSLARIDALRGQQGRARQRGEEALAIQHQLGDAWGIAYVSNELGSQARHAGDLERAQVMLEQAYALWRESGSRMGERAARMNLAVVTLERGDPERARALARDVLELCTAMADASATSVRCLEIASDVLRALRAPEDAVCLAAAADTHRQALGAPVPVDERPEREATLLAARAALPAEAFEQAWQEGIRLSIQEAVVVATDRLTSVGKRKPA
jgi:tetratricopeptide (TPR) repeat protein